MPWEYWSHPTHFPKFETTQRILNPFIVFRQYNPHFKGFFYSTKYRKQMKAGCENELRKLNEICKLWSRNYLKEFCWLSCLSKMTVGRKLPTIPWLSPLVSEDIYSRFFVVNSEANEISVIWRAIPFPRQLNPILQCCVGNKTQNVAFTCNTERHHRAESSLYCLIV